MDFLLILVAIGGFVVAVVMLVLASRVNRLQKESDERVETLEALATGSVLFARTLPAEPEPAPEPELATLSGRVTILEPAPQPPLAPPSPATDLDLALNEFADEDELTSGGFAPHEEPAASTPAPYAMAAAAYPFVMTVPAAAGVGRVQVSFDRSRNRSRA